MSESRHDVGPTIRLTAGERAGGLVLVVADGAEAQRFPLRAGTKLVIGRDAACELRLDRKAISRQHAELVVGEGEVVVRDLGSSNGTRVAGVTLLAQVPTPVRPGQTLELGDVLLALRDEGPLASAASGPPPIEPLVIDPAMRELHALVTRVAQGTISVLVRGETGAGKEVIAQTVHARSPRRAKPFVVVNCAALPENLLESELFGHEKGAFTGAVATKPGLLELADGGTVFFDELGEMPLGLQAKILRAIEDKRVTRLGGTRPRTLDLRFVSATNRDLEEAIAARQFRGDLYFRLAGVTIEVPPLRARTSEIAPIARRFVELAARELGQSAVPSISADALARLEHYGWPGNVRELRNAMERAVLVCAGPELLASHLPPAVIAAPSGANAPHAAAPHTAARESATDDADVPLSKSAVLDALERCGGNQTRAAALLGVTPRVLGRKLDHYGVVRPRRR
ncbi:MAG: sigma 54-interacting transcriptional regulator [Sandaracinaceae bacterium]|nr:sigma 54-interacting transcriptional regulator [Sandaracinaceae bacterium]